MIRYNIVDFRSSAYQMRASYHGEYHMSLLRKMESLTGVPIYTYSPGQKEMKNQGTFSDEDSPFITSEGLVSHLRGLTDDQVLPVIYQDTNGIFFSCIKAGDRYYYIGPISISTYTFAKQFQYKRMYGIANMKDSILPEMELGTFLNIICIIHELVTGNSLEMEPLAEANHLLELVEREVSRQSALTDAFENRPDKASHTYREKEYVMECIRNGDVDTISEKISWLTKHAGTTSDNQFRHYYNLSIVTTIAAVEAAIQGGVSPEKAYSYSDIMMQKISRCKEVVELNSYIHQAAVDCTRMVAEAAKTRMTSYTEICKNYINSHYRSKLSVTQIAENLGISREHLTRTFHQDTGHSIREYIQMIRTDRAMNLLKYSDYSITEICEYVGFSSQSEMRRGLKKRTSLSPRQYRELNKPKEFTNNKERF